MTYKNSDPNKTLLLEKAEFKKHFQAERWDDYNRKFFDGLAKKYDFLNEIMSFGQHLRIKKQVIAKIPLDNCKRVLDVCTGSGDLAILIARNYPHLEVVGLDYSEEMLGIARKKALGLANISFERADAMQLPFSDNSFDAVFTGFGLRNFVDLKKGLLELIRVVKPGCYVASLDLGKPSTKLNKILYHLYFERWLPVMGKVFFHRKEFNSMKYLPESNKLFPSQSELVEIFRHSGLFHVRNFDYLLGGLAQQIGKKIKTK